MFDKEFGDIQVGYRANMRRITARWKDGILTINSPYGVSEASILSFIDNYREQLRELRRKTPLKKSAPIKYSIGQRIPCFRNEVLITTIDYRPNFTGYKRDKDGNLIVFISADDNIDSEVKQNAVSGALKELMKRTAPHVLIPYAWEIAKEKGVSPKEFVIGRGARKLGHCTADKVIQLSFMLMFMPEDLVRYIICHELAHLTVMNHSPLFHALCNTYCKGKEKALERKLKGFKFPLLK